MKLDSLNSKSGLVLLLVFMWFFTLTGTVSFCIWIIIKGIDPQNAIVVTLLGMLIGQAFGNVNGALFRTMTGESSAAGDVVTTSHSNTTTDEKSTPSAS